MRPTIPHSHRSRNSTRPARLGRGRRQRPDLRRHVANQLRFRFLIDTGADFSVAPRRAAQQVGLVWDALPEAQVIGVERGGVIARLGHLPIRIGARHLSIRCLFMDSASVPFILGRADFLDHFVLTINQQQGLIILDEIP
jgi:predicted aspartyl protease